jgi:hypothetical protein
MSGLRTQLQRCARALALGSMLWAAAPHAIGQTADAQAQHLVVQAVRLADERKFAQAVQAYQGALDGLPDLKHPRGASKVDVLMQLSRLHLGLGDARAARATAERAIALCATQAAACPDLQRAHLYSDLAAAEMSLNDLTPARDHLLQADELALKVGEAGRRLRGQVNNNLGWMHLRQADCGPAIQRFRQSVSVLQSLGFGQNYEASFPQLGLAQCEASFFRFAEAEQDMARAWAILDRPLDVPGSILLLQRVRALNQWADILRTTHRPDDAMLRLRQARRLVQEAGPGEAVASNPGFRSALVALGNSEALTLVQKGGASEEAAAEEAARRALALARDPPSAGAGNAEQESMVAETQRNLGFVLMRRAKLDEAARELESAATVLEALRSPGDPRLGAALDNLSALEQTRGNFQQALRWEQRATRNEDDALQLALAIGDEEHKLLYLRGMVPSMSRATSIAVAARSPKAVGAAFEKFLNRRGRVQDLLAATLGTACRADADTEARVRCEAYRTAARSYAAELAQAAVPGDAAALKQRLATARSTFRERQADLPVSSRLVASSLSWQQVQQQLPAQGVLIEYVVYRPFLSASGKMWGDDRFGAFVLGKQGDPVFVPLAAVDEVDKLVRRVRQALQSPQEISMTVEGCSAATSDDGRPARRLDAVVFEPLRRAAGSATEYFVVPDGSLRVIPFAALQGADCEHLLGAASRLSYLTSGRDLVHGPVAASPSGRSPLTAVADPDFGDMAQADPPTWQPGKLLGLELDANGGIARLKDSALEAAQVARLFAGATVHPGCRRHRAGHARLALTPHAGRVDTWNLPCRWAGRYWCGCGKTASNPDAGSHAARIRASVAALGDRSRGGQPAASRHGRRWPAHRAGGVRLAPLRH